MRKLAKPTFSAETVYNACINSVNDLTLKDRLNNCLPEINTDEQLFINLSEAYKLHDFPSKKIVNNDISINEMKKIYTYRMVSSTGRDYYDEIYNSPKHGVCPLCGQRDVETVDHLLPKTIYPTLVVTPLNLIPSCPSCNKKKSSSVPSKSEEQPINPYFDDYESERWLFAEIIQKNPGVIIKFNIKAPETWDDVKLERIQNHFKSFGLSRYYTIQASIELSERKYRLTKLYEHAGSTGVKKYLLDTSDDFKHIYTNSWKTAMFDALASNMWFHETGLFQID